METRAMSWLSELIGGGAKEHHDDGSETERFENGSSITRGPDGEVREWTRCEQTVPVIGETVAVTRNGEGEVVNVQRTGR